MKWYLDTEFYEHSSNGIARIARIDLISLGLVNANGRKFYVENAAFNWSAVPVDHWLQANA